MDLNHFAHRLAENAETILSLLRGVTGKQACWKPSPEEWSLLEVLNHLYDEEREDFRQRLDLTFHRPGQPWPAIDPVGWVSERGYNQRDPDASLDNLVHERQRSVAWLAGLDSPDWDASIEHPSVGRLTAGDLLASWLAHDFLHIRQLAELHHKYASFLAQPCRTDYAGTW